MMPVGSHLRLQTQLFRLLDESKEGNKVSNQLVHGLSSDIRKKMGLDKKDEEEESESRKQETP